jgi:hypothetical protein
MNLQISDTDPVSASHRQVGGPVVAPRGHPALRTELRTDAHRRAYLDAYRARRQWSCPEFPGAKAEQKGKGMTEKNNWPEFRLACNGGGACVVVEHIAGAVVIRDSKNPSQAGLVFSRREYADFRRRVRGDSYPRTILQFAASVLRSSALILRQVVG